MQYNTIQYNTIQYNTIQYNMYVLFEAVSNALTRHDSLPSLHIVHITAYSVDFSIVCQVSITKTFLNLRIWSCQLLIEIVLLFKAY